MSSDNEQHTMDEPQEERTSAPTSRSSSTRKSKHKKKDKSKSKDKSDKSKDKSKKSKDKTKDKTSDKSKDKSKSKSKSKGKAKAKSREASEDEHEEEYVPETSQVESGAESEHDAQDDQVERKSTRTSRKSSSNKAPTRAEQIKEWSGDPQTDYQRLLADSAALKAQLTELRNILSGMEKRIADFCVKESREADKAHKKAIEKEKAAMAKGPTLPTGMFAAKEMSERVQQILEDENMWDYAEAEMDKLRETNEKVETEGKGTKYLIYGDDGKVLSSHHLANIAFAYGKGDSKDAKKVALDSDDLLTDLFGSFLDAVDTGDHVPVKNYDGTRAEVTWTTMRSLTSEFLKWESD